MNAEFKAKCKLVGRPLVCGVSESATVSPAKAKHKLKNCQTHEGTTSEVEYLHDLSSCPVSGPDQYCQSWDIRRSRMVEKGELTI